MYDSTVRKLNRSIYVNVKSYGAVGDGSTEDTSAVTAALAAASTGDVIYFPPTSTNIYIVDTVTVNKDVSFLFNGVTLKHKASATGHMLNFTVASTGYIEGGIMDGNKSNQSSRYSLLYGYSNTCHIRNIRFQNYVRAGYEDEQSSTGVKITGCQFIDGADHGGTVGQISMGIRFNLFTNSTKPRIDIDSCDFIQTSVTGTTGAAPGGIIIAGDESVSCYPTGSITNCYFEKLGQNLAGNHIGSIDLYEDTQNFEISNNTFVDALYWPIKVQNTDRVNVHHNSVYMYQSGAATSAIIYSPNVRNDVGGQHEVAIISDNIVYGHSTIVGIYLDADTGTAKQVNVTGNIVRNSLKGLYVGSNTGFSGPINVLANTFECTAASSIGIHVEKFSSTMRIFGNDIRCTNTGHGVRISDAGGNTSAELIIDNNYLEGKGSGFRALWVGGVSLCAIYGGIFRADSGQNAILLDADPSANDIGTLVLSNDIVITQGSFSIDYTDITTVKGSAFGTSSPEGVVTAGVGTKYIRTDGSTGTTLYIKESGTGNTGWAAMGSSSSGSFTVTSPASGSINGVNQVFTFNSEPIAVIIDNMTYFNGDGYTKTGSSSPWTVTTDRAPVISIKALT